jgi:hypothetical protein
MVETLQIKDNRETCIHVPLKNFAVGRGHSVTENQEVLCGIRKTFTKWNNLPTSRGKIPFLADGLKVSSQGRFRIIEPATKIVPLARQ